MLRFCLDVVLHVCSLSPSRCEPFLKSASLGQGVILDRRVFSISQIIFILYLPLKLCNRFETKIIIKFNFQRILFV
jgi:hypothetical protein